MKSLIDDKPGRILTGGKVVVDDRYVEPTVVAEASLNSKLMSDEIFGPILPVVKVGNVDEALTIIKTMEKPLSMYIFSKNRGMIDRSGVAILDVYSFG